MELDQATEQFYEKLSERLKEKGFSTRIIEDGCLEVTSEKIRGKQKTHCAVGRDGEVYCLCEKGWTHGYNRPSDRNGCAYYEER